MENGTHTPLEDIEAGVDVAESSGSYDAAPEHETILNCADRHSAAGTVCEVVVIPNKEPKLLAAIEIGNDEDANDHAKAIAENMDSRLRHRVRVAKNTKTGLLLKRP